MNKTITILLSSLILIFSSCQNDPCADQICEVNSYCQDGTCECEAGYSRNADGRCVINISLDRDKFAKVWSVSENCSSGSYLFSSTIVKSPTEEDQLIIYNFYDVYDNVYAVMTSANTFDIPLQVHYSNRVAVSGSGTYAAGRLTVDYNIENLSNNSVEQCSATYN